MRNRLQEIKDRLAAATRNRPSWVVERGDLADPLVRIPLSLSREQRMFVAYAPDDVRWLVEALESLTQSELTVEDERGTTTVQIAVESDEPERVNSDGSLRPARKRKAG